VLISPTFNTRLRNEFRAISSNLFLDQAFALSFTMMSGFWAFLLFFFTSAFFGVCHFSANSEDVKKLLLVSLFCLAENPNKLTESETLKIYIHHEK
jgi:hypothetical protein